jgi:hypothetical protein
MNGALVPSSHIPDLNDYKKVTETRDTFWRPCKYKSGILNKKLQNANWNMCHRIFSNCEICLHAEAHKFQYQWLL